MNYNTLLANDSLRGEGGIEGMKRDDMKIEIVIKCTTLLFKLNYHYTSNTLTPINVS